ncbi:MAG: hypothetical protein ACTSX6_10525 [Candidatus Heimdallarchaeaceae archaeon]
MMENWFVALMDLIPLIAVAAYCIKLNGKEWFVLTEISAFLLGVYLTTINKIGKYPTWILEIYIFFFMGLLAFFTLYFGHQKFSKILATSLLIIFVGAEYWEIPIFLYSHFHIFGHPYITMGGGIHQIYVLTAFLLLCILNDLKFTKKTVLFLSAGVLFSFVLTPPITFLPTHISSIIARFAALSCLGGAVFYGDPLVCAKS